MSSREWKKYIFSDFVTINPSVKLESSKQYSYVEMKDLNENRKFTYPSVKRKLSGGSRFHNNDTLFARITPCLENGKICQVQGLENGVGFGSTEFLVFRGKEGVSDSNFVFYLSRYDLVRKHAEQNMLGTSGRQRVPKEAFDSLEINLPPLPTQRRIADILSALDEKIELNRQVNATLESMAGAIFREWFVEGAGVGNWELGDVGLPSGWRVGKLGEVVDINMGQSPPGESYNQFGDGVIFFQGKAEFGFRFPTIDKYTTEPKRFANKYDTLLSVRAPVGTINMAMERYCIGRGLAAITGKDNAWSFAFYNLKNLEEHFNSYEGTGTVFGSINKTELENISVVIPPKEVIFEFEKIVNQIDEAILNNEQQTATLAGMRDGLLPRLMSGEVGVS